MNGSRVISSVVTRQASCCGVGHFFRNSAETANHGVDKIIHVRDMSHVRRKS